MVTSTSRSKHSDANIVLAEQLGILVRDAGATLLASLGCAYESRGSFDPNYSTWGDLVSLVGFGGDQLGGNLFVATDWALAARLNPVDDQANEALVDWMKELANMALGNLKASLLRRGWRIHMGIPTALVSRELRVATTSSLPIGQAFACGGSPMLLGLDWVVSGGAVLGERSDDAAQSVQETEGMFVS